MAPRPKSRTIAEKRQRPPPPSDPRYHTPRWLAVADKVRERDEWDCQACKREGGIGQVIETQLNSKEKQCRKCRGKGCGSCGGTGKDTWKPIVDHIKPAFACTDEEFYDPDNLEVSCPVHNSRKRESDRVKYGSARR